MCPVPVFVFSHSTTKPKKAPPTSVAAHRHPRLRIASTRRQTKVTIATTAMKSVGISDVGATQTTQLAALEAIVTSAGPDGHARPTRSSSAETVPRFYDRVSRVLTGVASKRFEIVRDLGEGGMGVVYEALDRDSGARVALKTLKHTNPEALARLKREFRAMQDLQHPSLVGLRELVFENGRWFIVMDLVEGVDFISHVRTFPWSRGGEDDHSGTRATGSAPTMRAIPLVPFDAPFFDEVKLRAALQQVVEALEACHTAGFVHRDVKPSNVLVTRAGKVVVLDFGLVTDTRSEASTQGVVGTPAYMAPEQAASGD